jgi:hypothetical protein
MRKGLANWIFCMIGIVIGICLALLYLNMFTNVISDSTTMKSYPLDINGLMAHTHKSKDVEANHIAPTLTIEAKEDMMKKGNFNLHLVTTGFEFAPEMTSMEPKFGQGHAHVYVDHVLIGRAYSEWFHIPKLRPGRHTLYVTLNGNDHKEYSIAGKSIDGSIELTVK